MKRLLEVSKGGLLLEATGLVAKPLRAGVNFIKSSEEVNRKREKETERREGRERERDLSVRKEK